MSLALVRGTPIPPPPAKAVVLDNLFATAADAGPPQHKVPYIAQEQDKWCWAACFEMIRAWMKQPRMSQHQMAKAIFGDAACASASSATCNKAAFPDEAANKCGLRLSSRGVLTAAALAAELRYGPVEAYFLFRPGARFRSHVALIVGIRADGTLDLLDPWLDFGKSNPTIEQLSTDYHAGSWKQSYVQFGPSP